MSSSDGDDPNAQQADESAESVGTPLGDEAGVYIPTDEPADDGPEEAPIDFGGFIVSLGTSCMVNLGHVEDPETGASHLDLPAAKQTIEILELLEHKTRGNLEPEEEKLLESLLHDTRMAYKKAKKQQSDD